MPTARGYLTSSAVNGVIYCVGWYDWTNYLANNQAYNRLWTYTWDLTNSTTTLVAWQTLINNKMVLANIIL
jgi:hypothetical protein